MGPNGDLLESKDERGSFLIKDKQNTKGKVSLKRPYGRLNSEGKGKTARRGVPYFGEEKVKHKSGSPPSLRNLGTITGEEKRTAQEATNFIGLEKGNGPSDTCRVKKKKNR